MKNLLNTIIDDIAFSARRNKILAADFFYF